MKIRKEKKKKLEENRIMGEDPEYEYEWNNFVIVQVIDFSIIRFRRHQWL